MAISAHYITVKGIKIFYETNNGPTDKPTIVCLHTAGRDTRQYHWMMDIFEDKYRMVAFDMPAHGKSWPLPGNKAISNCKEYGDFAWEIIKALKIENPVVIGCSVGGNMVYYLAQNYPIHAICSMQGADYTPNVNKDMLELLNHPYISVQHSHIDFSDSLIGKNANPEGREFIMWGVAQECAITKQADLGLYNDFDVRETMNKIYCPVLVIHGSDDWGVFEDSVKATIARMTSAKKLVHKSLPNIGHFPIVEKPELVCTVLDEFLSSI